MLAGVDEAGRGPVLGPLVVAGVAVPDDGPLRALGVKDSKALSAARREALDARIRALPDVRVALRVLEAADVDAGRARASLNTVEAEAFAAVLEELAPRRAILDACDTDPVRFARSVASRTSPGVAVAAYHKADVDHPVVSAASIVAKVERDRRVAAIADALGEDIGSGYPSDPTTMRFLRSFVARHRRLPPHARASWEPARELLARAATRRLDAFP